MTEVTVVIPAWGAHAQLYLREAVESLLGEVDRGSLLIVDNASDVDVSVEGVRVLRLEERRTIGRCRTLALEHVHTPYVMFWDVDDVLLAGTLGALVEALDDDPQAVAASAPIFEDDLTPHGWPRPRLDWVLGTRWPLALLQSTSSLFPTTGAVLMRTEALLAGGAYPDGDAGDDWVAGLSLALRGRITCTSAGGRIYRRHPFEISSTWTERDHADAGRLLRERIRCDPAATRLRPLLPVVWVGQRVVARAVRPLRRKLRPRLREQGATNAVPPGRPVG